MRIIEPSFSLETPFGPLDAETGIRLLRWIERNARISHASEDRQTEDSWRKFIRMVVVDRADWSVAEHVSVTAIIRTDRGITHELVRHRHFSFTQESTRFVRGNEKYGLEFIYPVAMPIYMDLNWLNQVGSAEENYFKLLVCGIRPQEARSILPNALAATISMTGNLRAWRWFFLMRMTREAHPDMRRIAGPMLTEFKRVIPILFDDIVSGARQVDNERMPQ